MKVKNLIIFSLILVLSLSIFSGSDVSNIEVISATSLSATGQTNQVDIEVSETSTNASSTTITLNKETLWNIRNREAIQKIILLKNNQKLNIISNGVDASTTHELETRDSKLYLIENGNELEVEVLPSSASVIVKRSEPGIVENIELKVENNIPIYEITSTQKSNIIDGIISVEIINKVNAETGEIESTQKVIKKNNLTVVEEEKTLVFIQDNKLVGLADIDNKEIKRSKLLAKSVKPLVSLEKIRNSKLIKKEKLVLQVEKDCYFEERETLLKTDNYEIVSIETDDITNLLNNDCVIKIADEEEKEEFVEYQEEILEEEAKEKIKELELEKSSNDVSLPEELKTYLEEDKWELQEGQTSPYQQFITPEAVKNNIDGLDREAIYEKVLSYTWMSDSVLHNKPEKWLLPEEFLESDNLESNPIQGEIVSDCSEHANTLVSMLRASGVSADEVRVALGVVNFSGEVGGHAWVEIKEDGKWMVLESTSGPFYDETFNLKLDRKGVAYDYWKYHPYPVVSVWAYYNDEYYTDSGEEVAEGWSEHAESVLEENIFEGFIRSGAFSNFVEWLKGLFG